MSHFPHFLNTTKESLIRSESVLGKRERTRQEASYYASHDPVQLAKMQKAHPDWRLDAFKASAAALDENVAKNRYTDIVPYDSTRVVLGAPRQGHDIYINASWIHPPSVLSQGGRTWIASQAPLPETSHDFLSMFLVPSSDATGQSRPTSLPKTLIMLTACTEAGRQKSARYWPEAVGQSMEVQHQIPAGGRGKFKAGSLPPITVKWISSTPSSAKDEKAQKGWRTNKLHLSSKSSRSAEINHIEYLGWQDHGVPSSPAVLLELIKYVESIAPDPAEPIVIHCSAGVGRTGTYIAISILLPLLQRLKAGESVTQLFEDWEAERAASPLGSLPFPAIEPVKSKLPSFLSSSSKASSSDMYGDFDPVIAIVDYLRDQRTTMVQTPAQLAFIYETAKAAWQQK